MVHKPIIPDYNLICHMILSYGSQMELLNKWESKACKAYGWQSYRFMWQTQNMRATLILQRYHDDYQSWIAEYTGTLIYSLDRDLICSELEKLI